ncbi:Uu.00g127690.m01.CDS01 [Anthostomella pinea]|uniref:Uu.00g127690.m01.CDS01 n=1 Tax=Anthostomella pinea TaxID=933095 RepID=A0AAI8VI69_9PEZI|nr:Uu.00g127690.m01.CDS01 [Anthostomella pinea]
MHNHALLAVFAGISSLALAPTAAAAAAAPRTTHGAAVRAVDNHDHDHNHGRNSLAARAKDLPEPEEFEMADLRGIDWFPDVADASGSEDNNQAAWDVCIVCVQLTGALMKEGRHRNGKTAVEFCTSLELCDADQAARYASTYEDRFPSDQQWGDRKDGENLRDSADGRKIMLRPFSVFRTGDLFLKYSSRFFKGADF